MFDLFINYAVVVVVVEETGWGGGGGGGKRERGRERILKTVVNRPTFMAFCVFM